MTASGDLVAAAHDVANFYGCDLEIKHLDLCLRPRVKAVRLDVRIGDSIHCLRRKALADHRICIDIVAPGLCFCRDRDLKRNTRLLAFFLKVKGPVRRRYFPVVRRSNVKPGNAGDRIWTNCS